MCKNEIRNWLKYVCCLYYFIFTFTFLLYCFLLKLCNAHVQKNQKLPEVHCLYYLILTFTRSSKLNFPAIYIQLSSHTPLLSSLFLWLSPLTINVHAGFVPLEAGWAARQPNNEPLLAFLVQRLSCIWSQMWYRNYTDNNYKVTRYTLFFLPAYCCV